jgi:methylthioribose-1-phosphate isomerase
MPEGSAVLNYAFDVTPAQYITAIITEVGIAYPPFEESLSKLVKR